METAYINQDLYPEELVLHKKYARSNLLLDLVWTHCNIVADIVQLLISAKLFDTSQLNPHIALKAALLHDIGVYQCGGFEWLPDQPPCDKPYMHHVLIGRQILLDEGFGAEIIDAAQNHTGVGITCQDIQSHALDLPPEDLVPQTLIGELVSYSAKFHSKAPKFKTVEEISAALKNFGEDKVVRFQQLQQTYGVPNLEELIKKHEPWHQGFAYKIKHFQDQKNPQLVYSSAGITKTN